MSRTVIKVTGAQGQGVNSVGDVCAKGLKRSGYCVFGYREYMSLIKGGHSSYQIDISNEQVGSSETTAHIVVCFNYIGLRTNIRDLKPGGFLLHQTPQWKFGEEDQTFLDENNITVLYIPMEKVLKELKANPILANIIITSVVWSVLRQDRDVLKGMVKEQFGHKGEELVNKNYECIDFGFGYKDEQIPDTFVDLPEPNDDWKDDLLITGSEAMGLGMVHAGCRMYTGYPMTPSSPLLAYVAKIQNKTGMVIKQAEDEITAAQMMSGGNLMGTRAATGTSGGGFDLMTETLSLNAIIENPSVFYLAQRPGPGTGLPTWTCQADLLLAVHAGHGEYPRCVICVSDAKDSFSLMTEAFNIAEQFRLSVIIMTDKHTCEAQWTEKPFDQDSTEIRRGPLVTDAKKLKELQATDYYKADAEHGVSPRWLPGAEAPTWCAQGDEHNEEGVVDESAENAIAQMDKRMKKMDALRDALPEPELYGEQNPEILLVGWGSTKAVALDVLQSDELKDKKLGYLHFAYLWPLRTGKLLELAGKAKKTILVEGNQQGQLGMIVRQECGLEFDAKILKYDGRPFFYDELIELISNVL